jgi:hypothetical protein
VHLSNLAQPPGKAGLRQAAAENKKPHHWKAFSGDWRRHNRRCCCTLREVASARPCNLSGIKDRGVNSLAEFALFLFLKSLQQAHPFFQGLI